MTLPKKRKHLWNVLMIMIPILVGALGTSPRGLERGLEDLEIAERIETIYTLALLGLTIILLYTKSFSNVGSHK